MQDVLEQLKAAADRAACIDITVELFLALDRFEHRACVDLMTPDGSWDRLGTLIRGREAVFAMLEQRVRTRRTCHVLTNLKAALPAPGRARVEFLLQTYEGSAAEQMPGSAEPPVGRLVSIRRGIDEMQLCADGWRITHKASEAVFKGMPAPTQALATP